MLSSMSPTTSQAERSPRFQLPGAEHRTMVIGRTGSGKTVMGFWLLSKQNFDRRPWVGLDFKGEEFWDRIGPPYVRKLGMGAMPGKTGLYRMPVLPGQEDRLDEWLWKVWRKGNIGLFIDEFTMMDARGDAMKAILRTGRSLRIPVIACTQRPVDCGREIFTESRFKVVFPLEDEEDYRRVKQFTSKAPIDRPLEDHHAFWYDGQTRTLLTLTPVPPPDDIAKSLRAKVPLSWML